MVFLFFVGAGHEISATRLDEYIFSMKSAQCCLDMYLSMVNRCISQKYNLKVSISLPVYITESGIGLVGQGMEISGQRTAVSQ